MSAFTLELSRSRYQPGQLLNPKIILRYVLGVVELRIGSSCTSGKIRKSTNVRPEYLRILRGRGRHTTSECRTDQSGWSGCARRWDQIYEKVPESMAKEIRGGKVGVEIVFECVVADAQQIGEGSGR